MYYIALARNRKRVHPSKIAFYDTNFPAMLMKHHARLVKTAVKDRTKIKYDAAILKHFIAGTEGGDPYDRIYFPFCLDQKHWIGVCLDLQGCTVEVLDCNHGYRSESMMKKDLNPITIVVPHLFNSAIGNSDPNLRKPYKMVRVKDVPQNNTPTDAATTTVLLIQAHALTDGYGCHEIAKESLDARAKHLSVLIYRDISPA